MPPSVTRVPDWYCPSNAPRIEQGGYWVPPLAAGLAARGDTMSLVVLKHRTLEPAYIRELPRSHGLDLVDATFAEAVNSLCEFKLHLCCAVEPWLEVPHYDPITPATPWLWVRYPHAVTCHGLTKNTRSVTECDSSLYFALALATQMQKDFNLLEDFDREFRQLRMLDAAMENMRQLLMTRLPEDMQRVAGICHDLSF